MKVEHCCYNCIYLSDPKLPKLECEKEHIDFRKSFGVFIRTDLKEFGTKCRAFQKFLPPCGAFSTLAYIQHMNRTDIRHV